MVNFKKLLTLSFLAVLMMGCISTASAGWFDFADDSMTEHDFGNFTMNVPENSSFSDFIQPNSDESIDKLADTFGGSIHIDYDDPKWADPKYKQYFHQCWDNDQDTDLIIVEYVDYAEDDLSKDNVVEDLHTGAQLEESDGDIATYYWSDFQQTIFVKYNDDKSAVVIRGDNKELLNKAIESVEFK